MTTPKKDRAYKVICISVYDWDLKTMDRLVERLKARGLSRASRSWLIRYALNQVKEEAIERDDMYGGT